MNQLNQKQTKILLKSIFVIVAFALSIKAVAVWSPPSNGPTGGNTNPPVNVGSASQQKIGGLIVGGFRTTGPGLADSTFDVDGLVTLNGGLKITSGVPGVNKILSSDAAGTTSWSTLAAVGGLTNPMTTLGDIIYGGVAGVPTRLGAGTSGWVFTSNGPGAAPSWQVASGGAPINATFITQTANATLTNEQALSALATGIVKNTTGTGVLSIATTADFPVLNQNTTGTAGSFTGNLTGDVTSTGMTTTYNNTVPFGKGGTGVTTAGDDTILVSSGAAWQVKSIPNCTDTGGNHLNYATASNTFSCGTSNSGGGGGMGGSGTTNRVPKFTAATTIGDSSIWDNGNVGIGTTNPTSKFSVVNTSSSENIEVTAAGDAFIDLNSTVGSGRSWSLISSGTSGIGIGKFSIFDGTSGVSRLTVGTTGLVGIGNTAPTELLTLGSNGGQLGSLSMLGNTSGKVVIRPAAAAGSYTLILPTTDGNANEFLQTDGAGNLGWAASSAGNLTGDITSTGLATTYNNTVPLAKGGTGLTSIAARTIWVANSANTLVPLTPGAGQSIRINAGNTAWEVYTPGSGGAPTDATFITQTANTTLTNEQALSTLGTGILKNTTGTGVLSIATTADFPVLNQNTTGTAGSLSSNGTNCSAGNYPLGVDASGNAEGCTPSGGGADNLGNHTANQALKMAGFSVNGNTTAGGTLTLDSTSNATKGNIILNPTGGNVGIGITNPGAKLEVNGQVKITGGTPGLNKVLTSDANGLATWQAPGSGADNLGNHTATQALQMAGFAVNGSTLSGGDLTLNSTTNATKGDVYINSTGGNIGLGTTGATRNIGTGGTVVVVGSSTVSNPSLVVRNGRDVAITAADAGGANFDVGGSSTPSNNFLQFRTNNSASSYAMVDAMRITSTGDVGIGTTAPTARLHLVKNSTSDPVFKIASDYNFSPINPVNIVDVAMTGLTGTDGMTVASFTNSLDADLTDTIYGAKFSAAGITVGTSIGATFSATGGTTNIAARFTGSSAGIQLMPHGINAGNTSEINFFELAANGTNFTGFKSPDSLTADIKYTLPSIAPTAGQVLSSTAAGVLSWTTAGGGGGAISALTLATAANTINNANFLQEWQWNTLGATTGLKLSSSSTVAPGTTQRLFEVSVTGTGAGGSVSTAAHVTNSKTNSGATNIAGYFAASGGTTNNIAVRLSGNTGAQFDPFGTSAGNTSEIRFLELAANGTNYTAFKSADAMSANLTYTWPTTAPTAGQVLSSTAAGVLSWTTAGGGGSTALSGITAATAANTIDNGLHKQTWQWNSVAAGSYMTFIANAAGSGATEDLVTMQFSGGSATGNTNNLRIVNNKTGSTNNNTGIIIDVTGGGNNYALVTTNGRSGFGTAVPNAKAIVEMSSTTQGFLPPRMTTAQRDAIASPPIGLVIFNTTTNKLNVRGASAWEAVTSS